MGDTKLLCPSGYKPNSVGTDCEEIKVVTTDTKADGDGSSTTVNADTSIVREETPDGSVVEYTDTKKISQIDALKSQSGYNSAIHSVYNYAQDDKNPKFAVFCKDDSTGLESPDSLNCVACTSSLRRGVCLENNPGFGVCVQCGVGKVYDKKSCKCVNAVAYSMKDLAFGENEKAALNRVCWAKDDNDKYRECVFWDESKKKQVNSNNTGDTSRNNNDSNNNGGKKTPPQEDKIVTPTQPVVNTPATPVVDTPIDKGNKNNNSNKPGTLITIDLLNGGNNLLKGGGSSNKTIKGIGGTNLKTNLF